MPPRRAANDDEHPVQGLLNMLRRSAKPKREVGELDGNGYCPDCGLGPFGPGVYFCLGCSEDQ